MASSPGCISEEGAMGGLSKQWIFKPRFGFFDVLISSAVVAGVVAVATYLVPVAAIIAVIKKTELPRIELAAQAPRNLDGVYRGKYQFTTDWFTRNIPVWKVAFAQYSGKPGVRYLEIGVFEGRSLLWLLENILTEPTSHATAIDVFYGDYESRYRSNLDQSGAAGRVTTIKASSRVALRDLPAESFDVAYIDGSHAMADVLEDAVLTWQVVKPGGLIIFDDYQWVGSLHAGHEGDSPEDFPKPAIDAFCRCFAGRYEVIHNGYQVILRKIQPSH
jgi:hypothetical protein